MTQRSLSQRLGFNVALTVMAFGLAPFFKKLAIVDGISQWTVALVTASVAALVSVSAVLVQRPGAMRCLVARRHLLPLLALGVVAGGIVTLLVVQALTVTTATNRSLFQSAYPAATLLFAHMLLGERLRGGQYVAVVALSGGLLLMNGASGSLRFGAGFWLLLATLPLIGISDTYSKRLTRELSPIVIAGARNVYGAMFLLLVTPMLGLVSPTNATQWLWLGLAGLLQGLGVWTLYRAMEASKASMVAALVASTPLLTLAAEYLFIGVELTMMQWAGLMVVLLSSVWLGRSEGAK